MSLDPATSDRTLYAAGNPINDTDTDGHGMTCQGCTTQVISHGTHTTMTLLHTGSTRSSDLNASASYSNSHGNRNIGAAQRKQAATIATRQRKMGGSRAERKAKAAAKAKAKAAASAVRQYENGVSDNTVKHRIKVAKSISNGLGSLAGALMSTPETAEPAGPVEDVAAASVVIGEDMVRVNSYGTRLGASTDEASQDALAGGDDAIMAENRIWIRDQMASGRSIVDIGPAPGRANFPFTTSPYYQMELGEIWDARYPGYVNAH